MKKVVAFIGSPRKKGNTVKTVNEILKGVKEAGGETKIYYLNDMNIKPCQGCLYCRKEESCAIKDDMQTVYQDMKEADAIVIGSPIYFGQMSAQTKIFIDRLYSTIDDDFKPRFGSKNVVIVYSQTSPNPEAFKQYIDFSTQVFGHLGWEVINTILNCGDTISDEKKEDLEKAYKMGREIV